MKNDEYYWFTCIDETMCVVQKAAGYYTFSGTTVCYTYDELEPYGMLGKQIIPPNA